MTEPLVVVVVPVFDGGDLLAGCLESILAQTHRELLVLVADNASTDDSVAIAEKFIARDRRVRLVRHDVHLPMLEHWNRAFSYVPEQARYVKQLNVDDRLRPDGLRRLVEIAEAHPGVAVVSAFFMFGRQRLPRLVHDAVAIIPGREAIREVLRGGPTHLGHPSALLLRHSAVRCWSRFYEPAPFPPGFTPPQPLPQADKEACFDLLERFDLAFVPEVLADLRSDEGASATGVSGRVGAWHVGRMETLLRHGHRFLTDDERRRWIQRAARRYLRSLAWRTLSGAPLRVPEFLVYQRLALPHVLGQLRGRDAKGGAVAGLALWAALFRAGGRVGRTSGK